jgi:hypothetical protein
MQTTWVREGPVTRSATLRPMRAPERPLTVGLLIATSACCLALALVGATDGLPFLVPALLLALPLARGLYVGESTLLALAAPSRRRSPRAPARSVPTGLGERHVFRGARLIAASLAKRPPPHQATV